MDYGAALGWLQERQGTHVGVLFTSVTRDELPQGVLHGELLIDEGGSLVAGINALGAAEAAAFHVGASRDSGFTVVRALVTKVDLVGSAGDALRIEQEGVAIAVWPHSDDPESIG